MRHLVHVLEECHDLRVLWRLICDRSTSTPYRVNAGSSIVAGDYHEPQPPSSKALGTGIALLGSVCESAARGKTMTPGFYVETS